MARPSNKWLIAAAVSTGAVMATIDTFILFVASSHLRGVFSSTISEISWINISYTIAALVFMPLSGWLAATYGKKTVYQFGIVTFTGASILCGLSSSIEMLIAARLLQGMGAGILLPVENLILRQSFPSKQHGLVMGIYGATAMVGPSLGPIIGGTIIDHFHWSLIFFVNIPIGIIGFLMVHHFVPRDKVEPSNDKVAKRPDIAGIVLLVLFIAPLVWFLERGEQHDWLEDQTNFILLFVAVSSLLMFCAHELMTPKPVVDLRILRNRQFSAPTFMNFLLGFVVTATLFILPLYMQEVLGYTASKAGLALAPRALLMMIAFPIVGIVFNKVHPKLLICFGFLLGLYSAYLMSEFSYEAELHHIIIPQLLMGFAITLTLTPLATVALMSVSPKELPGAVGLDSMARQIGAVFGIAVFASMYSYFEQLLWSSSLHNITLHHPVFFNRFSTVSDFYMANSLVDPYTAGRRAYIALNNRLQLQVAAVSYIKIFEWIAAIFALLVFIAMTSKLKRQSK